MAYMKDTKPDQKPRAPIKVLVDYKESDVFLFDYTQNISRTGLFLETTKTLPIGATVLLSFTLPQSPRLITALGEVVWSQRTSYRGSSPIPGMGIHFREISNEDEELIAEYIRRFEQSILSEEELYQDIDLENCTDLENLVLK
ncbi:MAG: TIGR02266 family protein [Deltaproteobacteria bacterium]|nr:MAG: TIGR02266 family protein [Deltaproteobacteria bacterium]